MYRRGRFFFVVPDGQMSGVMNIAEFALAENRVIKKGGKHKAATAARQ